MKWELPFLKTVAFLYLYDQVSLSTCFFYLYKHIVFLSDETESSILIKDYEWSPDFSAMLSHLLCKNCSSGELFSYNRESVLWLL